MTGIDFLAQLQRLSAAVGLIERLELDQMIDYCGVVDGVAPLFEGDGSKRVEQVRAVLVKAREFRDFFGAQRPAETMPRRLSLAAESSPETGR